MQKFLALKELAKNSVGVSNRIFEMELSCILRLYRQIDEEITNIETEITSLTLELNRPCLTIPGEGKPHRVAMSHVAKKLIRLIYTLETTNQPFNADKLR